MIIKNNLFNLANNTVELPKDTVLNGDFFKLDESIKYSPGAIFLEFQDRTLNGCMAESVIRRIEGYCVDFCNKNDVVKELSIWCTKTNELIIISISVLSSFNIGDLNEEVIVKYPDAISISDNCM